MGSSEVGVEVLIEAVLAAAREHWPHIQLDRASASQRARYVASGAHSIHYADLALAWAALAGDPSALRAIEKTLREEATRAILALRRPTWQAEEVRQELALRMLVVGERKEPTLATYAGRSALGRWVGVAAMRTALNLGRRGNREDPLDELEDGSLAAAAPRIAPELAIVRARYKGEVEQAMREAFEDVRDVQDRNLLRFYYLDRIELEPLGKLFGVHGSTISRRLSALRTQIAEATRVRLVERLGMEGHTADVASLIRAVHSDFDLSLSQLLPR
jgi:RNA polymerase sigma-70 factor (ECF subfamily)